MANEGSRGGLASIVILAVLVHFFVGWDWLENFKSNEAIKKSRRDLVTTLTAYNLTSNKKQELDPARLGQQVPEMTEIQLEAMESGLKGNLVTARAPVYDIQKASDRYGLQRFEVVIWAGIKLPAELPIRGTCVAINQTDASWITGLSVGQRVAITGKVVSVGRYLGVTLEECVLAK